MIKEINMKLDAKVFYYSVGDKSRIKRVMN